MSDPTEEDVARGYHEDGTWGGHVKWKCNECAYDSVDESYMPKHMTKFHLQHTPQGAVVLTDSGGRPIE